MNKYTAIIQHSLKKSKGFGNISIQILMKFRSYLHIEENFFSMQGYFAVCMGLWRLGSAWDLRYRLGGTPYCLRNSLPK